MQLSTPLRTPTSSALAVLLLQDADRAVIAETPEFFLGVKRFRPGEVFQNHFHEHYDEYFVGLSGSLTVWQGRILASELTPGASVLCRRGSHHALVNTTAEDAVILFVKTGRIADDTIWVPWEPGPPEAGDRGMEGAS